ncbi:MAG TPA: hypothetical protein VMV38_02255 [Candidatus Paceibacterota bacterium]|nr:hypothetical protein [Candidatus Paceibacterota bacterium]
MKKYSLLLGVLVTLFLLSAPPVMAQSTSASSSWGNSAAVSDMNAAESLDFNNYIMRHRIGPYSTAQLHYTDNSTHNSWAATNCTVAGGCQTGGSTVAINGYTSQSVTGNNNSTTTGVGTTNTNQSGTASSLVTPENIGTITIGGH